jgi:hypothetical protein
MRKAIKRNQGRQRKEFAGDPLGAFMLERFCRFAFKWPREDLERLSIEFDSSGWLIVGNNELVHALYHASLWPEKLETKPEYTKLFLVCFGECPDFTLGVVTYLRKEFAKLKPHKKAILFNTMAGKVSDAEKTERSQLRKLVYDTQLRHKQACEDLRERYRKNMGEKGRDASFPPFPGESD